MIKINLVPQELLDRERQQQRSIQLVMVGILVAVMVVGITYVHWRTLRMANLDLAMANKEYNDKWADVGSKLDAKRAAVAALQTRLGVITDLLKSRAVYPHFMADMAHAMPSDIWVTGITTSGGANIVKVSAQAMSSTAPGITHWIRIMQKPGEFGSFSDPAISAIGASDDPAGNGGKQYAFTRGAILAHVTTHGMHHRAQCLNMLRHIGVSPLPLSSVLEWMRTVDGAER